MKKSFKIVLITVLTTLLFCGSLFCVYALNKDSQIKHLKEQAFILSDSYIKQTVTENPYPCLPIELSQYVLVLAQELEIDPDLCIAILLRENPEVNFEATHRNSNGTLDVGLWQLNDRYLYTSFSESYWSNETELDAFNWKHNTYIALHHIAHLTKRLKVFDDIVMAYNCGAGAVISGRIPESTRNYLKVVKNNYLLLKNK